MGVGVGVTVGAVVSVMVGSSDDLLHAHTEHNISPATILANLLFIVSPSINLYILG